MHRFATFRRQLVLTSYFQPNPGWRGDFQSTTPGPCLLPLRRRAAADVSGLKKPNSLAAVRGSMSCSSEPTLKGPELPPLDDFDILKAVTRHVNRISVIDENGSYLFGDVLAAAHALLAELSGSAASPGDRVALISPPGVEFVSGTWATWMRNCVSVPLALSHPPEELKYVVRDSGATVVLAHPDHAEKMAPIAEECGARLLSLPVGCARADPQAVSSAVAAAEKACGSAGAEDGSVIIYTSGTTGRPKGALHTRGSVSAQAASLTAAWAWRPDDRIAHTLPLHHIHGLINALHTAHANGAAVHFQPFSPGKIWRLLKSGDITVFMGVPTMYSLLLSAYEKMGEAEKAECAEAAAGLRLAISGSAACPLVIMDAWEAMTGRPLLERYGMTEIGMALSNPYEGERRPGAVGLPLPGVEVRMTVADDPDAKPEDGREIGELRVRAPQVFAKYWGRPDATRDAFDEDGFFLTGDTVMLDGNPPYWRIVGRTSVDIIKSSGYKISALDIENKLLQHPAVNECAVLGVPDDVRGEIVGAVIACRDGEGSLTLESLAEWCRDRMPAYHVPRSLTIMDSIPRNAMGKINKKELLKKIQQ